MAVKRPKSTSRPKAATADIVGDAHQNERVPHKWKKQYARLMELRDSLLNHQGDLVKDAVEEQPAFSLHMADAATDSYDRDFALSRISSEQDAVYEIDEALKRIRDNTYGICELTGKPIEAGRLEAIPWTRFSKEAERSLEREGAVRRARLAPRAAMARGGEGKESAEAESNEPLEHE